MLLKCPNLTKAALLSWLNQALSVKPGLLPCFWWKWCFILSITGAYNFFVIKLNSSFGHDGQGFRHGQVGSISLLLEV